MRLRELPTSTQKYIWLPEWSRSLADPISRQLRLPAVVKRISASLINKQSTQISFLTAGSVKYQLTGSRTPTYPCANKMSFTKKSTIKIVVGLFVLVGLIVLIVGIVLIVKSKSKECQTSPEVKSYDYSEEALRAGMDTFLEKVQSKYYELHPEFLILKPGGVDPYEIKTKFKPYNPNPNNLKKITDASRSLLKELEAMNINTRQLKPREKKALAQVKHYLESNFGRPYDKDYYAGDFLMGPNLFCWQDICNVGSRDIRYGLANIRPKDNNDVQLVLDKMKLVSETFVQYINNLKYGVNAGMVRSVEECKAGIDAFKQEYLKIAQDGETGSWYMYLKGARSRCFR